MDFLFSRGRPEVAASGISEGLMWTNSAVDAVDKLLAEDMTGLP